MTTLAPSPVDRPMTGVLLMLGFCALAPLGDAIAKLLGETIPLLQLLLVRFAMQAALLLPMARLTAKSLHLSPRVFRLMLIRTALHIAAIGAMFTSLRFLPLAEAVAIAFVMPFIMLLLGHYVLGEEVGIRRLSACLVGFAGTLLVIQPSFANVGWPALLPLLVALIFSLFMMVTRQIARETDPISLQAVSGVYASLFLGALVLLPIPGHAFGMISPSGFELTLLLVIGLLGTGAHLLMTWSLRFAPAATLAPMQYLEIPIATILGYLIFHEFPNGLAMLGITITVAAGLYIILRERKNTQPVSHDT